MSKRSPNGSDGSKIKSTTLPPPTSAAKENDKIVASTTRLGSQPSPYRFAGAGMELAGFSIIPGLIGYGIDNIAGFEHAYCTAAGTLIGFSIGMLNFIRLAISLNDHRDEKNRLG